MVRSRLQLFFVACLYLSRSSVQAVIFSCRYTAPCGCSRYNANINARIVGGERAPSHSWSWMASLRLNFTSHQCGAIIFSDNFVLTAAHCVRLFASAPSTLSIVIDTDTLNTQEGQRLSLSTISIHPSYNFSTRENDIAILRLSKPIDFNDVNIAKICLPNVSKSEEHRYPIINRSLVAIGWGHMSFNGSMSYTLRQVTVKTIGEKENMCKNSIYNVKLQFCAAVNDSEKDTCQGDSGGPLMYYSEEEQVWVLAGITSYGRGCALSNYAGIYTRVSAYTNWIQSIVDDDGMVTIQQNGSITMKDINIAQIYLPDVMKLQKMRYPESHYPLVIFGWDITT
ncbi:unnamed protein product [Rotaria magnacalcarata]|uniref:Peptidase S1 domain-containing protein n=1 Tax=Rotaria magnacalcarata TaxID=392030 RepID=A0A816SZY5_9BILA|nr:unnamed protein product [Rotaria magnacalcarata]